MHGQDSHHHRHTGSQRLGLQPQHRFHIVKVVAEKGGPVLGVHMVGPHVTDLISEAMLITNWEAAPAEVAALFRVDPKTVTRWAKAGKLTSIRTLGGHRRYRESEVRNLLKNLPNG